ncbi:MAG: SPFH domain-containing protein [Ignavibacteriales bacterium]|nr:SPFH domain-containing protein [Ignavibacteriales bacterium]
MKTVTEINAKRINAFVALLFVIILLVLNVYLIYWMAVKEAPEYLWIEIPLFIVTLISFMGFFIVQPNEARVLVFFGKYIGSVREAGFWYANPFAVKKHVSLRIRNFNSERIKVNDLHGNPIEIAAVVVWSVVDSARALFDVEHYENFVAIQSETAIRALASEYPYDAPDEDVPSLRGRPQEIAERMKHQVQTRLEIAGVEVNEARISHLAYAQEIAQTMLRRQQAQAIIAARKKIVEGAVGMVDQALKMLSEQKIVTLDEEKKATMVNNLMVALVSETAAQPIINTGTLYQ